VSTVPTRVRVALSVCTIQGSLRYSIGKYPEPSRVQGLVGGAARHTSMETCTGFVISILQSHIRLPSLQPDCAGCAVLC
jgi:hypothetical protein